MEYVNRELILVNYFILNILDIFFLRILNLKKNFMCSLRLIDKKFFNLKYI